MMTKSLDIFQAGFRASHVNLPASSTSTDIISNSSPSNDILQNIQYIISFEIVDPIKKLEFWRQGVT